MCKCTVKNEEFVKAGVNIIFSKGDIVYLWVPYQNCVCIDSIVMVPKVVALKLYFLQFTSLAHSII
jgi:hypothetical protein